MTATLLRLAGIDVNVKYGICSWQSGQKDTSWIGPGGGGEAIYIGHKRNHIIEFLNFKSAFQESSPFVETTHYLSLNWLIF